LPVDYANIRRLLITRRYLVLDERASTHKHKFVINSLIDRLGEAAALRELEKTGVIHSRYKVQSITLNSVTLVRDNDGNNNNAADNNVDVTTAVTLLEPPKIIRMIGEEEDRNIPLLARVNEKGFVKEVDDTKVIVNFEINAVAQRVKTQLSDLPIIIIPDDINLTKRVLEPMHRFHRLAADIMLPSDYFGSNRNDAFS
jgi:hypothetical protein